METYDYVVIGSGFGGSVSALRLSEKGYKVLVIEKGKWFDKKEDFPKTNWNLRKWMWYPKLGLKGMFQLHFFRHVAVLNGVAVGGGSIVYANTLPIPKKSFFESGEWKGLRDWENELAPHYETAKKMLGASKHPYFQRSDEAMLKLAEELGDKNKYEAADVAVYFGKPGETVDDPYFDGKGPNRTGCIECGACMLGCPNNAKNTLDKNYLYLAQQLGCTILAETEVVDVIPLGKDGNEGYEIVTKSSTSFLNFSKKKIKTKGVIFSGGVMGTLPLLLKLKNTSLPHLSDTLGKGIRTNSESLIGVTSFDKKTTFSKGIAIGSIVHIDENRHVEPVKYSEGSGFWRIFMAPMVSGKTIIGRMFSIMGNWMKHPLSNLKIYFVDDWSKRTHILLYMESIDSTLSVKKTLFGTLKTRLDKGKAPSAFNPKAQEIANKIETIIDGKAMAMITESLLGIPTTAHILGGACMGRNANEGVIDDKNQVYNYQNMLICDGSMISANPGVNPSLSITAISELAMSHIPQK
ncbi:MAG: hypothetical protein RL264_1970 [Bacteroidota bacterium]|jgi:cholesterol oxidase